MTADRNEYIRAEVVRARVHRWHLPPAEERNHLPFVYALKALPPGSATFVVVASEGDGHTGLLVFMEDPALPRRVLWTQVGPWSPGEVNRWIDVLRERYHVRGDAAGTVVRVAPPADHDYLSAGDNPHASGDVAWQGCTVPEDGGYCGRPRDEHRDYFKARRAIGHRPAPPPVPPTVMTEPPDHVVGASIPTDH